MDKQMVEEVLSHPKFKTMAKQKSILGWTFSIITFVMYVAYILFMGIAPHTFSTPVSEGAVTTWGIYIGLFVIVFSVVITGIYVHIANGKFEKETKTVVNEVMEKLK